MMVTECVIDSLNDVSLKMVAVECLFHDVSFDTITMIVIVSSEKVSFMPVRIDGNFFCVPTRLDIFSLRCYIVKVKRGVTLMILYICEYINSVPVAEIDITGGDPEREFRRWCQENDRNPDDHTYHWSDNDDYFYYDER